MSEQTQEPLTVRQLTEELIELRRRGIEELDDAKPHPKQVPGLDRLAQHYARARGRPFHGRIPAIRRLMKDGLAAYAAAGHPGASDLIRSLFFAPPDSPLKPAQGELLAAAFARVRANLPERDDQAEKEFRKLRHDMFAEFAEFLADFVVQVVNEAAARRPPPAAVTGAVTPPAISDTGASPARPPSPDAAVSEAAGAPPVDPASAPEPPVVVPTAPGTTTPTPAGAPLPTPMVTLSAAPPTSPVRVNSRRLPWRLIGGAAATAFVVLALAVGLVPRLAPHTSGGQRVPTATAAPGQTWAETAGEFGSPTFTDPHSPRDLGPRIEPYQQVRVACKVFAPTIPSISPDGYWYMIANPAPLRNLFTPATNFLNGDSASGVRKHYTDFAVVDCPS